RDADELHDVLHTLVALPEEIKIPTLRQVQGRLSRAEDAREMGHATGWAGYFERLVEEGRAGVAVGAEAEAASGQPAGRRRYWVAAERARSFATLFPSAQFEQILAAVETTDVSRD